MSKREKYIPGRPEFEGTIVEALVRMRAPAGLAVWACRYTLAPWPSTHTLAVARMVWLECPRPDWLVELIVLSEAYKPASEPHQRLVRALCAGAEIALRKAGIDDVATWNALREAGKWSRGESTVQDVMAAAERVSNAVGRSMRDAAEVCRSGSAPEVEHEAFVAFGASTGAFFAATTTLSAAAASTAAMSLALALDHDHCSPKLANLVREHFPEPPAELLP